MSTKINATYELINTNVDGKMVASYTFNTKDGKPLTVSGETALAVSQYFVAENMEKSSALVKALSFYKLSKLSKDTLKSQYSVKDGKAFFTKFIGGDGSQYDNYVLAVSRFYDIDDNGDARIKDERFANFGIGKLIKLGRYFADAKRSIPNDEELADMTAWTMLDRDMSAGLINWTMSDKALEKAIKTSLEKTVDIPSESVNETKPTAEENKPTAEENKPTAEENKPTAEDNKPTAEDNKNTFKGNDSRCYASFVKLQLALEEYAKFEDSKEFAKLSATTKSLLNTCYDAMMFAMDTLK